MRLKKLIASLATATLMMGLIAIPGKNICLTKPITSYAIEETAYEDLDVKLSTDKSEYSGSDAINATLKVTNNKSGSIYEVQLDETVPDGYTVADGSNENKVIAELKSGETVELDTKFVKKSSSDNNSSATQTANSNSTGSVKNINSNPETGNGGSALPYILAVFAVCGMIASVKSGKGKKMLSLILAVTMLTTLLPGLDIDVKADGTDINVSTNVIVDGRAVTLSATVKYSLTSPTKQFDENNVGEIYFSPVDEEHIATGEDGITMYADNEILVVAKRGVTKSQIEALAAEYDAEIVGYIEQTGDYQWKFDEAKSKEELGNIIVELQNNSTLIEVGLNYIAEYGDTTINPGNEYVHLEKHSLFDSGRQEILWGHEVVKAKAAWTQLDRLSIPEENYVRIGLVDGGFYNHEDLGFAQTFYNEGYSSNSHGTHVAGTMAARGDNAEGICGIYPYGNGNLYGVSYTGMCTYSENKNFWQSFMTVKVGFAELIFRNVKVINFSQGFNWYNNSKAIENFGSLENLMNNVQDQVYGSYVVELKNYFNRTLEIGYDYVIVASAGNDSSKGVHYNAKASSWITMFENDFDENYKYDIYDRIIVVGSVGKNLEISDFSNSGDRVDIYAPGEHILSTLKTNSYDYKNCDSDVFNFIFGGFWNGTSMASPHVAGAAADVWTVNNNLTGVQVKEIISKSTISDRTVDNNKGIIDVAKAVYASIATGGEGSSYSDTGIAMGWVFDNTQDRYNIITSGKVEYNENTWKGVENCTITAFRHGENDPIQTTTTDSEGHYELMLPAGEYDIRANHNDYGEKTIPQRLNDSPVSVYSNQVTYCAWIVFNDAFSSTIAKIPGQDPITTYSSNAEYAWTEYDHPGYDTSAGYDKHIIIDGNNIKMDGYLQAGYKDFLFVDDKNSKRKIFELDFQRDQTSKYDSDYNWHSMYGGGFLFNTSINEEANTINGYYILITEKGAELFKIDNMAFDSFRNSENRGELMETFSFDNRFDKHHIKIDVSSNSVSLYDGEALVIDNYELTENYGNGFGPITSHISHDCEQRSFFTFSNISMQTM